MFPDSELAVAQMQSCEEDGASRGLAGWVQVCNSLLRLALHMGSVKSCAVPWQGARFVFHFKLKLFKGLMNVGGGFSFSALF